MKRLLFILCGFASINVFAETVTLIGSVSQPMSSAGFLLTTNNKTYDFGSGSEADASRMINILEKSGCAKSYDKPDDCMIKVQLNSKKTSILKILSAQKYSSLTSTNKSLTAVQLSSGKYFTIDLAKKNAKFKSDLSLAFNRLGIKQPYWVFSGVESPLSPIKINGTSYVYGSVCKPHQCDDHALNYLYDQQTNHLVGMYQSDDSNMKLIGDNPTQEELSYLRVKAQN